MWSIKRFTFFGTAGRGKELPLSFDTAGVTSFGPHFDLQIDCHGVFYVEKFLTLK